MMSTRELVLVGKKVVEEAAPTKKWCRDGVRFDPPGRKTGPTTTVARAKIDSEEIDKRAACFKRVDNLLNKMLVQSLFQLSSALDYAAEQTLGIGRVRRVKPAGFSHSLSERYHT